MRQPYSTDTEVTVLHERATPSLEWLSLDPVISEIRRGSLDSVKYGRRESGHLKITVNEQNGSKIAVIESESILIENAQDALDLLANVWYNSGCDKMVLRKEHFTEAFFDLKTGLAGEILQKFTNYRMKVVIVGDFSSYQSNSLNAFMYESNQGNMVLFKETESDALEALHQISA